MEDYMMMWGRGFVMFHSVTGRWHVGSGRNVEMHEIRKSDWRVCSFKVNSIIMQIPLAVQS